MEKWSKERFWEMVRECPEYKSGELAEEQAQGIVDRLHADQEQIIEDATKAEIRRTLIEMTNKGQVDYDPETDTYRISESGRGGER